MIFLILPSLSLQPSRFSSRLRAIRPFSNYMQGSGNLHDQDRLEALDAKSFDLLQTKTLVDIGANVVLLLAALMLLAVTLTFPFPFVRKIWLGDIWGYYGLLNSVFFILIARAIKKLSLAAVFAGIGIVFFEQLLTWHSFWFLHRLRPIDFSSLSFAVLSVLVSAILLTVFIYSLYFIVVYRKFKQEFGLKSKKNKKKSEEFPVFMIRLLAFSSYFLSLYLMTQLNSRDAFRLYGKLRLIGGLISMTAPLAAGAELDRCLKKGRMSLAPSMLISLHAVVWATFLGLTFFMMPLDTIIKRSAAF